MRLFSLSKQNISTENCQVLEPMTPSTRCTNRMLRESRCTRSPQCSPEGTLLQKNTAVARPPVMTPTTSSVLDDAIISEILLLLKPLRVERRLYVGNGDLALKNLSVRFLEGIAKFSDLLWNVQVFICQDIRHLGLEERQM